jgi:hypothetical protein
MELQSDETSGGGQSAAETETDTRTADESTAYWPAFTPATREADDSAVPDDDGAVPDEDAVPDHGAVPDEDTVPDDGDTQARAVAEPSEPAEPVAGSYPAGDDVDEPVEAPEAVEADEPAGTFPNAEMGEGEPLDERVPLDEGVPLDERVPLDEGVPLDETPAAHEPWAAASAAAATAAPAVSTPPASVAHADLDQPLLSGDPELLTRWQRAQLGFIDDPQAAVAGAADIVEQAGRALVEALEQRQRQMRTVWDHSSADGSAAGVKADTEELRQMMRRYQALFNQLHQPA